MVYLCTCIVVLLGRVEKQGSRHKGSTGCGGPVITVTAYNPIVLVYNTHTVHLRAASLCIYIPTILVQIRYITVVFVYTIAKCFQVIYLGGIIKRIHDYIIIIIKRQWNFGEITG